MRIDVYSSSVCVCVWVCVCVVCDYAMNEVKCGYIYIFGWRYTSLWPSVWFVSVPYETSGAFDTYLNRECIRTKETYMYMKRAVYSSTVCVCVCSVSGAQTTRTQVHSINIWKESAYVQKRRIYIWKEPYARLVYVRVCVYVCMCV